MRRPHRRPAAHRASRLPLALPPVRAVQYDTDVTTWSPQGRIFQIEYAMEAVKQGSAAVGLKVRRGIGGGGLRQVDRAHAAHALTVPTGRLASRCALMQLPSCPLLPLPPCRATSLLCWPH